MSRKNASQHVKTKSIPCQRGTEFISTYVNKTLPMPVRTQCFDQTHHLPARTQNLYQHESIKSLSVWTQNAYQHVLITHFTFHRGQNISQLAFNKQFPWQRGHEIYIYLCWTNASDTKWISKHVLTNLACDDTEFTSTCVDQNPQTPERT